MHDWRMHMPSGSRIASACFVLLIAAHCVMAEERAAPATVDHSRLLVYWTADGQEHPVQTPADWAIRRRQIIAGMEKLMGTLPDRSICLRWRLRWSNGLSGTASSGSELPIGAPTTPGYPPICTCRRVGPLAGAWPHAGPAPDVAAGEEGSFRRRRRSANQAYGKELAERGYVVLAPIILPSATISPTSTRASSPPAA